jgi:glycosyltransferase involved in cell wall biosynthesis
MTPLRVCLVGLQCYDLLARAPHPRHIGGAERQQVFLARGLAANGHKVAFVTFDHGQDDGLWHDGIQVFKAYVRHRGLPGVRFVHPRWTGLAGAMRRAGADIYHQMGGDLQTGQVAAWCRLRGRRFVFSLASDGDCDPAFPLLRTARQRFFYRFGLRYADAAIAQTESQRKRLCAAFGPESTVIRSCTPDVAFDPAVIQARARDSRPRVLWVGRLAPLKRLEILLDLAAARPAWEFHVVGSGDPSQEYVQGLESRAKMLSNVSLHRDATDEQLHEAYLRAHVLVCTSSMEGVPTTFLEAWARALPVVSTVDPDGVIAAHRLGAATAPEHLAEAIAGVLGQVRDGLPERVRAHYVATHTVAPFVAAHERLFRDVLKRGRASSGHGVSEQASPD